MRIRTKKKLAVRIRCDYITRDIVRYERDDEFVESNTCVITCTFCFVFGGIVRFFILIRIVEPDGLFFHTP